VVPRLLGIFLGNRVYVLLRGRRVVGLSAINPDVAVCSPGCRTFAADLLTAGGQQTLIRRRPPALLAIGLVRLRPEISIP